MTHQSLCGSQQSLLGSHQWLQGSHRWLWCRSDSFRGRIDVAQVVASMALRLASAPRRVASDLLGCTRTHFRVGVGVVSGWDGVGSRRPAPAPTGWGNRTRRMRRTQPPGSRSRTHPPGATPAQTRNHRMRRTHPPDTATHRLRLVGWARVGLGRHVIAGGCRISPSSGHSSPNWWCCRRTRRIRAPHPVVASAAHDGLARTH